MKCAVGAHCMLLAGVAFHIGCFTKDPAQNGTPAGEFFDKFSVFSELGKLSLATWFSVEVGTREAFGNDSALCGAVAGFRDLLLTPRLFTTGVHFGDREHTVKHFEELGDLGVQHIVLRVDEDEAARLGSGYVQNLVEGCHAGGIDLKIEFELRDSFTEDCCRIARVVEDRQFTVTVMPVRARPRRSMELADAPPIDRKERVQIVLNETGELMLRRRTQDEVIDMTVGNAQDRPLHELIREASAGL